MDFRILGKVHLVRKKRAALLTTPIVLAAIGGVLFVSLTSSGHAGTVPSGPMPAGTSSQAHVAFAAAAARAGFGVTQPTYFPTSAAHLAFVDARPETAGQPRYAPYIRLVYFSGAASEANSSIAYSRLIVTLWADSKSGPTQSDVLVASDVAGLKVYVHKVAVPPGSASETVYTAIGNMHEIMLTFVGDQPTASGVEQMLSSFKPVS